MFELDIFIEILEASVKKNGEVALTNLHLLNICKLQKETLNRIEDEATANEDWRDD